MVNRRPREQVEWQAKNKRIKKNVLEDVEYAYLIQDRFTIYQ